MTMHDAYSASSESAGLTGPALHGRRIKAVVIGGSAGSIDALLVLLQPLPADFALPVIVVVHVPAGRETALPQLLRQRLRLSAKEAGDKEQIVPGTVYLAPPGYHLLIERDASFSLSCEEPVEFARPSIDVLMESAADAYGDALVGVLLTGANRDGARGIAAIKANGGLTIVQDPAHAQVPTMPAAAIALRRPDFIEPLAKIGDLLLMLHHGDNG